MSIKNPEFSAPAQQGESPKLPHASSLESQGSRSGNAVLKSGPLLLQSKGIGWTSWKKRWFVLTRTSLIFFRSDPNVAPQRSGEVNMTLGGFDLNSSGSVDVKPDKKLLTVLFPDGRDGRTLILKAETSDELHEWKCTLETALAQAPTTSGGAGQNGIVSGGPADAVNSPSAQPEKDKTPVKSMVIGRPVLFALQEVDGSPAFLEKALKYIEEHGVKTEGILRQAADVELVELRVQEYEQGKTEFSPGEDAHVIADCIKHVLRELPSSPVPASCCTALLDAYKSNSTNRVNAIRLAILETFPEPNRKLLQRILVMMRIVAAHKAVNRMSVSAVAACMSPLLLRPLLAGDCQVENQQMDVAGDNSLQLLQAAAAANHAQAIVIILLEEYEKIFGSSSQEGSMSPELFSDSEVSGSESGEATDEDDEVYEEDSEYESDEVDEESGSGEDDAEDDDENSSHESCSDHEDDGQHEHSEGSDPASDGDHKNAVQKSLSSSSRASLPRKDRAQDKVDTKDKDCEKVDAKRNDNASVDSKIKFFDKMGVQSKKNDCDKVGSKDKDSNEPATTMDRNLDLKNSTQEGNQNSAPRSAVPRCLKSASSVFDGGLYRRPRWGRQSGRRNLSMESIEFSLEEEDDIEKLEAAKKELEDRIAEEVHGNAALQASLERRKKSLGERRIALERDVERLEEQLKRERELREALEAELRADQAPASTSTEEMVKAELNELATAEEYLNSLRKRVDDLGTQFNQQREDNLRLLRERNIQLPDYSNQSNDEKEVSSYTGDKSSKRKTDKSSSGGQRSDDMSRSSSSRGGIPVNPSPADAAGLPKPTTKKAGGEGTSTATSALSKLTTRLNFLKERRNQLSYELQNLVKPQDPAAATPPQPENDKKTSQGQEGSSSTQKREGDNSEKRVASSNQEGGGSRGTATSQNNNSDHGGGKGSAAEGQQRGGDRLKSDTTKSIRKIDSERDRRSRR